MKDGARPWLDPSLPTLAPLTESEKLQNDILRKMTPVQRWEQAFKLREMAWAIRKMALRKKHPDWTEAEVEGAVRNFFLRATT